MWCLRENTHLTAQSLSASRLLTPPQKSLPALGATGEGLLSPVFFEFTGGSKQSPVVPEARLTRLVAMWGAVQAAASRFEVSSMTWNDVGAA